MARSSAPAPSNRGGARPQDGKRRPDERPRRKVRRRTVLGAMGGIVGGGAVLGAGGFATAYTLIDVPAPNELADAQVSTVYFSDGTTELGTFAALNRRDVSIDEVPDVVQHAVLAAEDRSFYENRGVSPSGIARAVWTNLRTGSSQGGSTITQQYVKNYYLTSEQTYTRKLREFVLALKIDQQESKGEILENYLNTVYFGRRAYGIQAASQAYFGIDVGAVNASQAALLASLLKAPSSFDPRSSEEAAARASRRVEYVLDGMVAEGWLSQADRAAAGMPDTVEPVEDNQWSGPNGYLLETVRRELVNVVGLTEDEIDRGGLRIQTTFSRDVQDAAVAAVQDELPAELPTGFHVALSAVDPATGGIVAMYGGADYVTSGYNTVTRANAQAGSTFKPFTLVAALEKGISLRSTFSGRSPMEIEGAEFENFGDQSYGSMNLLKATASSVNTVYVQLNEEVTPQATRDVAIRAGYPADTTGLADANTTISNVLGTASPHPLDVTSAYATFAAQGVYTKPHSVVSVDDSEGTRTYTASPDTSRAFSTDVAADLTYALEGVVESGSGRYARNLGRPAAGKTGTSSSNYSAWFAGFVPQLAASVALFQSNEDGSQATLDLGGGEVTGGSYPVRIWTEFMKTALEGTEEQEFPDPANIGTTRGSSTSTSTSTGSPTDSPTETSTPTDSPTDSPTGSPSGSPTDSATQSPTGSPTDPSSSGSPSSSSSSDSSGEGDGGGEAGAGAGPTADAGAAQESPATVG